MEVFKSLWRPRGNIAIPEYGVNDGVDLQVKCLLYMYKRLGIVHATDKLERQALEGIHKDDIEQLDKLYNLNRFLYVIFDSPHRVLVDWPKNRFRAMLILPHMPQMEQLPSFPEPHFRFTVLEADASNDEYIRTLSLSDIYVEHNLPREIRHEIAATIVRRHSKRDLETRALIILEYVQLVATEIQVARIYKAMLAKMQSPNGSAKGSPQHSPLHSPASSRSASPTRTPLRAPSPVRQGPTMAPPSGSPSGSPPSRPTSPLRPSSPSRFPRAPPQNNPNNPKLQPSAPKLRPRPGSPVHSPQGSPHGSPHGSPPGSPNMSSNPPTRLKLKTSHANLRVDNTPNLNQQQPVAPSMEAGKKYVLHQARLAVQARLDKEKSKPHIQ